MKVLIRAVVAILALGLSAQAMSSNIWRQNLTIKSVITGPNSVLLLLEASEATCGPSGDQFNVTPGVNGQTADGMKMALSVAMLALATDRKVSVVMDPALPGCPVQQILVSP